MHSPIYCNFYYVLFTNTICSIIPMSLYTPTALNASHTGTPVDLALLVHDATTSPGHVQGIIGTNITSRHHEARLRDRLPITPCCSPCTGTHDALLLPVNSLPSLSLPLLVVTCQLSSSLQWRWAYLSVQLGSCVERRGGLSFARNLEQDTHR